ncbi:hypothetical protein F5148DRAFT_1266966, partial [Russula earlei]
MDRRSRYYLVILFCRYANISLGTVATNLGTPVFLRDVAHITLWHRVKNNGEKMNGLLLDWHEFIDVVERYDESLKIYSDLLKQVFNWTQGHVGVVVELLYLISDNQQLRTAPHRPLLSRSSHAPPTIDSTSHLTTQPSRRSRRSRRVSCRAV